MMNWYEAGNINMVHALLMNRLVPLYFSITGFTLEPSSLLQKYRDFLFEFIKDKIEKQALKGGVTEWKHKGQLLLQYLRLLRTLAVGKPADLNLLKTVAADLGLKPSLLRDPMHRKIWEHLIIMDAD